MLENKRTIVAAVVGILFTLLKVVGVELPVGEADLIEAIQVVAGFVTAIFLRLGVLKAQK